MQDSGANKIVVVCGPTGSGKTAFAIDLARRFGGEIVGADSMQIYRYMDIGTAKPTPEEQAAAPHHMIDIVDPDEDFDAAIYAKKATDVIRQILDRGGVPLVVGGTAGNPVDGRLVGFRFTGLVSCKGKPSDKTECQ